MMKKLKILLADDEAILRLDLREMLTDAGHEVIGEAANGNGKAGKILTTAKKYITEFFTKVIEKINEEIKF